MNSGPGTALASAIASKDRAALRDLLDAQVDFRGMTPGRCWEASSADALVDEVLFGSWFDDGDHIESLEAIDHGSVVDRERVAYRLRVRNADGTFLVEQQAYLGVEDGRITWLRVMCSGFRRVAG